MSKLLKIRSTHIPILSIDRYLILVCIHVSDVDNGHYQTYSTDSINFLTFQEILYPLDFYTFDSNASPRGNHKVCRAILSETMRYRSLGLN